MERCVAVIAAHPDDAEIGMGGTILALRAANYRVVLIDLTDGEPTPHGSPEIRAVETKESSAVLGVTDRVNLRITNREVFDTVENRKKLATEFRKYKPEVIFVPYWEDGHPDHIQASHLCDSARFYGKFVKTEMPHDPFIPRKTLYYFSTHIRVKAQPAFIFDISPHVDKKFEALSCYRSQFSSNQKNTGVFDLIRSENRFWGAQIGAIYGEPFACREQIRVSRCEALLDV